MISAEWLAVRDEAGQRLKQPQDWVRRELEHALAAPDIVVIPVLTDHRVKMPGRDELPPSLADLAAVHRARIQDDLGERSLDRLIERLRSLVPPDPLTAQHGHRVRNFLDFYLNENAFGGRVQELLALDRWLEDPEARPYRLLIGPPGRGKSALLAQWTASLRTRSDIATIFFPVSLRFSTATQEVLQGNLTQLLLAQRTIRRGSVGPTSRLDAVLDEVLRTVPPGKTLVLVVDGLDEANNWDSDIFQFSRNPANGVRVLVSTRDTAGGSGRAWLQQLGWDRPGLAEVHHLGALDLEGVEDLLLAQADLQTWPETLGAHLYELTDGDPLLLTLYLDELRRGANPIELDDRAPVGLDEYLERWWKDQRKTWPETEQHRTTTVRDALTRARGPLSSQDLLELLPGEFQTATEVDSSVRTIARFVVGDGLNAPYAFSHPRLTDYFDSTLHNRRRREIDAWFVDWGETIVGQVGAYALEPDQVSPYLREHLGAHLVATKPTLTPLLCGALWRKVWFAHERDAYIGFLADVNRAWDTAKQLAVSQLADGEDVSAMATTARAALTHSSIRTHRAAIPAGVVVAAYNYGVIGWDQAITVLDQIVDPTERAEALCAMAASIGITRPDVVEQAVDAVLNSELPLRFRPMIAALAPHLRTDQLRQLLNATSNMHERTAIGVIDALAKHLPEELLTEAESIAGSVKNGLWQVEAFARIALYLEPTRKAETIEHATAVAESIESRSAQAIAFSKLAAADPMMRDRALAEAERLSADPDADPNWVGDSALVFRLLLPLFDENEIDRFLDLVRRTPMTGDGEVRIVSELARRFPVHGAAELARLREDAEMAEGFFAIEWAKRKLALMAFAGGEEPDTDVFDEHLTRLVGLASATDSELLPREEHYVEALTLIGELSTETALLASPVVEALSDAAGRAQVLNALLPRLPAGSHEPALARELRRAGIADTESQLLALSALAPFLRLESRVPVGEQLLTQVTDIAVASVRCRVISNIAEVLPHEAIAPAVRQAFDLLEPDSDSPVGEPLAALAAYLPDDLLEEAIERALAIQIGSTRRPRRSCLACHPIPYGERSHNTSTGSSF